MDNKKIKHLRFNNEELEIFNYNDLGELDIKEGHMNWINIPSLDYTDVIDSLTERLGISPMVVEDIKDVNLLPKVEDYKDYIFMIIEDIKLDDGEALEAKQMSIILFKDLIISIEESESDIFDIISKKIKSRINLMQISADSIFYELVDIIVEDYFNVLEGMGERIDDVEDRLLMNPMKETLNEMYMLKRDLISTRKTLWLMRNAINKLIKNEFDLVGNRAINYFRELYDNIVQLVDLTETYRDICSGMLEIYLSSLSNKTNDIMKVLTILSTIFIPLTFLAGVYGMNFKYFPEIHWEYGYIGFWIISIIITAFMIRFFKKKKWM